VDARAALRQEGNALVFSRNGAVTDRVTFASAQPVPTTWERFAGDGALEMKVGFADYLATPAGLFPSTLMMEAPLQKRKLTIRYEEPEINAALAPELFTQTKPGYVKELPIEALGG
jgi:hypothetical protein